MNSIAKLFSWNVICQVCRKKIKAEEAIKRWDGLIVCKDDQEYRHPRDMPIPPQREQKTIPFSSPEQTDTFVTITINPGADTTGVLAGTFETNNKTI